MKRFLVVVPMRVVFPLIQVAWELAVLVSMVWKFEEANFLVAGGSWVNWRVYRLLK
jgi:hypothetical protein